MAIRYNRDKLHTKYRRGTCPTVRYIRVYVVVVRYNRDLVLYFNTVISRDRTNRTL